jgi:hypothetical protein
MGWLSKLKAQRESERLRREQRNREAIEDFAIYFATKGIDRDFATRFYIRFQTSTGIGNRKLLRPEDEICGSLGVCEEDLDDAYVDMCRYLDREPLTKEEAKRRASVITVEDLLMLVAGLPSSSKVG